MSTYSYVPLLQQGTGMTANKTGGPAFPFVEPSTAGYSIAVGMTLRDYFAATALPRVMQDGKSFSAIAEDAYDMADAMLKARKA